MKIGDKFTDVQIYGELCCEDCGQIIHNHIDCPVCKTRYADTGAFYDLSDDDCKEISCEVCKTVFRNNLSAWYYENELEIISLDKKYMENSDEN